MKGKFYMEEKWMVAGDVASKMGNVTVSGYVKR